MRERRAGRPDSGTGPGFEEVVDDLTRIVDTCREERSRLGVFPAMYRTVTTTVGAGIDLGVFHDPARVERLMAVFADLYVQAFDTWRVGAQPAVSWDLAFEFAAAGRGSIAQHLLLGMNAHINLDLGIATAAVCAPGDHEAFRCDFDRVNDVLFALVDELQAGLGELSPWMSGLDRLGLGWDEAMVRSGIRVARDRAWAFSGELLAADAEQRAGLVVDRDCDTHRLGEALCHRWSALHLANRVVARRECPDVGRVIDTLGAARIDVTALTPG